VRTSNPTTDTTALTSNMKVLEKYEGVKKEAKMKMRRNNR
jgi:hypothetical protein